MSGFSYADAFAALVPGELVAARFWSKVDVRGPDECWPWVGGFNSHGYGAAYVVIGGRSHQRPAQRVAWELCHGILMVEDSARHECDHPWCVNPHHVLPGTPKENSADAIERGRIRNGNEDKTHCPQGHPYAGDNLLIWSGGHRVCRACRILTHCSNRHATDCTRCKTQAEAVAAGLVPYLGANADKTHCLHGHPLVGSNVYVTSKGGRQCQACAFMKTCLRRHGPDCDRCPPKAEAKARAAAAYLDHAGEQ